MANAGRSCSACCCRNRRGIEGAVVDSDADPYQRALLIRERKATGKWLPIIWHSALRGDSEAIVDLADWLCDGGSGVRAGSDRFNAGSLYRRASRAGSVRAAHNLAMAYFNQGDLANYRRWVRQSARLGDPDSRAELRYFETRLPHHSARRIRRHRPWQKRDDLWGTRI